MLLFLLPQWSSLLLLLVFFCPHVSFIATAPSPKLRSSLCSLPLLAPARDRPSRIDRWLSGLAWRRTCLSDGGASLLERFETSGSGLSLSLLLLLLLLPPPRWLGKGMNIHTRTAALLLCLARLQGAWLLHPLISLLLHLLPFFFLLSPFIFAGLTVGILDSPGRRPLPVGLQGCSRCASLWTLCLRGASTTIWLTWRPFVTRATGPMF